MSAKWTALHGKDATLPEGKDPDKDGIDEELGEGERRHTRAALESLYSEASSKLRGNSRAAEAFTGLLAALGEGATIQGNAKGKLKVIGIAVRIRYQIESDWKDDIGKWQATSAQFAQQVFNIATLMQQEQQKQRDLLNQVDVTRGRVIAVANATEWFEDTAAASGTAKLAEQQRCASSIERNRLKSRQIGQMRQKVREIHATIALEPPQKPDCKAGCSGAPKGMCAPKASKGPRQLGAVVGECVCAIDRYSVDCGKKLCPGRHGVMYQDSMTDACHGGKCNTRNGRCEACPEGRSNGLRGSCEVVRCSGDCNGRGTCSKATGKCDCQKGWSGKGCALRSCAGTVPGKVYPHGKGGICSGRGTCDGKSGKCNCKKEFSGTGCRQEGCLDSCSGHGKCDGERGKCICRFPYSGPACLSKECPNACNGHGLCDPMVGKCTCQRGYVGGDCHAASTCNKVNVDWWTSFDKRGWSICPKGHFVTGLYRRDCKALACLEMAQCAQPCAGALPLVKNPKYGVCYHAAWHDKLDETGWAKCRPGYFIAGFYRSKCDSLYCLQLAKCCSIPGGSWGSCTQGDWSKSFDKEGWAYGPADHFLTGLFRSQEHNLNGIRGVVACKHHDSDAYEAGSRG